MDKIKKMYTDSRYKTNGSISNSDLKPELQEALALLDNTVCYIDDISIPHSWYTIEDFSSKLYIQRTYGGFRIDVTVVTTPIGSYNASRLASTIQGLVQQRYTDMNCPDDEMTCTYDSARGTIKITATFEFQILSDFQTVALTMGYGNSFVWVGNHNNDTSIDISNPCSTNELLRHYSYDDNFGTTYESGFIDILNVHSICTHCTNLGHYSTIGVRGENPIIKKVPVSSSFGYLISDSVVAPHDKIDVSKQIKKTMHFSLKNVHGNVINPHGSHASLSLIFQTYE